MPYFQCAEGALHFLSDLDVEQGGMSLLPEGCKSLSDDKVKAIQSPPPPSLAELAEGARLKRGTLIAETDYMFMSDYPASANLEAVKAYRQALRNVPEQATFPQTINWPEKP